MSCSGREAAVPPSVKPSTASADAPPAALAPHCSLGSATSAFRRWLQLASSWLATQLDDRLHPGPIPALDGVRAIACLCVMGYHINLIARSTYLWVPAQNPLIASILLSGNAGVTLFFVLSGLLLFLPYARALTLQKPWPDARLFYLRRALHIMLGYYASLFLIVMLETPQYLEPRHWRELALFVFLLMDSTPATFQKINGPYWTLAIEWQVYLLLPRNALGIRFFPGRWRPAWRVWAVRGCLVATIGWELLTRSLRSYFSHHPTATTLF